MLCREALTSFISLHKLSNLTRNKIRFVHNFIIDQSPTPDWIKKNFKPEVKKLFEKLYISNRRNALLEERHPKRVTLDTIDSTNVLTQHRKFSTMNAATIEETREILEIKKLIKKHTRVTRDSMTPEIALHLITPSCSLWTSPLEHVPFKDPFWAFYWPGGQALARYILDNPNLIQGQGVVDIGSGCGATAIAAAMSNANNVIANDIDPVAACAIYLNCALNNIKITVCTDNIIGKSDDVEDTVLVGDMFYDDEFASVFMKWLQVLRTKGKQIVIGDPGRHAFVKYKDDFQCLIEYPLKHSDFCPGFSHVSIWKMK